jgi:hypothetical protein
MILVAKKRCPLLPLTVALGGWLAFGSCMAIAQDAPDLESRRDFRYSFAAIDDVTNLSGLQVPIPMIQNRLLLEPAFTYRWQPRWSFASSLIGLAYTDGNTHTQLKVKETYAGLSAGDYDFTVGRRIVRWGTGYAFTAAGVLDPPRVATDPNDRLNLNEGRDMVKADWVHGPHAITLAWSTAALEGKESNLNDPSLHGTALRDTLAFRYNVLVHGFDAALIAGDDRGGEAFGGLTFTRVFGQAWELHGEATWREHAAILLGGKYITPSGISFIAEFYTPPNTPFFRSSTLSPLAGRQHYAFVRVAKSRLRELPGWKQWDLAGSLVENVDDRSYTAVFDVERRFGNRFSTYVHVEAPAGRKSSEYGITPYVASTSAGIRFQL